MGRDLILNVNVDGVWYGPAYPGRDVPAAVAAKVGGHAFGPGAGDSGSDSESDVAAAAATVKKPQRRP